MYTTEMSRLSCPYCGEQIEVVVDCSVPAQEYVEDCPVCCQPMLLTVHVEHGEPAVYARREDE